MSCSTSSCEHKAVRDVQQNKCGVIMTVIKANCDNLLFSYNVLKRCERINTSETLQCFSVWEEKNTHTPGRVIIVNICGGCLWYLNMLIDFLFYFMCTFCEYMKI